MKIIRDGKEIELTPSELYNAYEEVEHAFDMEDIKSMLDDYDEDDLMEEYGMDREQINGLVSEMAYRMRRYMDKYGTSFECARDDAINDIVSEHKADYDRSEDL